MSEDTAAPPDDSSSEPRGPDALAEALRRLAEAREYAVHLAAAEIDRFKLKLRRIAIRAIAAATALVLLLAILVAAAGELLSGLAQLIGSLLGGHAWLGSVITGLGILLLGALAVAIGLWSWQSASFNAARERFAARKRRQSGTFGRSVEIHPTEPEDE